MDEHVIALRSESLSTPDGYHKHTSHKETKSRRREEIAPRFGRGQRTYFGTTSTFGDCGKEFAVTNVWQPETPRRCRLEQARRGLDRNSEGAGYKH